MVVAACYKFVLFNCNMKRVTRRGGGRGGLPCPFSKFKKSALILENINIFIYMLNFSFKMLF